MPEKIGFILSTSRTGTKALSEGLQGGYVESPHQPPYSRLLNILSNYYLHGWVSRRSLEWLVCRTREKQIVNSNCPYYLQVFSLDYLPAKIISEKFQNVYIIHIVRDPRTFVRSYMNWTHTRFKSFVANKYVLGWHPSGFFTGEMSWREWQQMDEFQRVCWHWKYKNTLVENLFDRYENYIRVRFEDIFLAQTSETLKQILQFVGVPYNQRFETIVKKSKNVSSKRYFQHWDAWSAERRKQLLEICGEKMKSYGYEKEYIPSK